MKNVLLACMLLTLGISGFAQTTAPVVVPNRSDELLKKPDPEDLKYCCPKCNYTNSKIGDCPVDKIPLIKEGVYYCPLDYNTADKPGKCIKCGKALKKMESPTKQANAAPVKPGPK
jgi:hypothetical protein